ncbi:MAG: glycosyltransferase [Chloracidobacterium sp.]|nr:glycosyltransferase [Chloracidobacterium sp.]
MLITVQKPKPKVSVVMITYNHEKFIAQAIEGVLMQKTDFPFELIIGEDCSTDGTRKIAQDFQQKYPETVRLLTPESNLGVGRNTVTCLNACEGQYVTFCEGDDFWTDPSKLARQIELLDDQPEAAICFHKVGMLDDITGENRGYFPDTTFIENRLSQKEVISKCWIATCSAMFRRKNMPLLDNGFAGLQICDWALFILLTRHGYVAYIDEVMAQYRVHGTGVWSSGTGLYRIRETIRTLEYVLPDVFAEEKAELRKRLGRYYMRAGREALQMGSRSEARKFVLQSFFHYLAGRELGMQHLKFLSKMYFPSAVSGLRAVRQSLKNKNGNLKLQ